MSDSKPQESVQEPTVADNAASAAAELPGRRLREARENSHLSREEVAHHLRLDVQLISALEQDEYASLPSPAYICGYLRSYARLLKLPENEIVQAYNRGEQINATLIPASVNIKPEKKMNFALVKPVMFLIIFVLLGWGVYLLIDNYKFFSSGIFSGHSTQQQSEIPIPPAPKPKSAVKQTATPKAASKLQAPASKVESAATQSGPAELNPGTTTIEKLPTPKNTIPAAEPDTTVEQGAPAAGTPTASPTTASTTTATQANQTTAQSTALRMHFTANSWVEVTDATNNRLVYRLVEKDSDLNLMGVPPFTILLGNASAVQVFYKGKEIDHPSYRNDQVTTFKVGTK